MRFIVAFLWLASVAYGQIDPSKLQPINRDLKVWSPALTGETLKNYQAGGFVSTAGPTDKTQSPPLINQGKGLNIRPKPNATGTILVSNCSFHDISTNWVPVGGKPHTDGIFVTGDGTTGNLSLVIEDCDIRNIDGEGIHDDDGAWNEIAVRRCSVQSADGGRITIKLHAGWPIKNLTVLDTTANLYIDASHVPQADIPALLPNVTIGGLKGTFLVTVLDGTVYHSVTPDKVGLKVNGAIPPSPIIVPGIPDDFTGGVLFRANHDPVYFKSDGKGPWKLTGAYKGVDLLFSPSATAPADYWHVEYDQLAAAAQAALAAKTVDIDAQAALIVDLKARLAAVRKDAGTP